MTTPFPTRRSSDLRELDLLRHRPVQIADHRGEVAPAHIDIDPGRGPRILGLEHRRAFGNRYIGHGAERDLLARRGQARQRPTALPADRKGVVAGKSVTVAGDPGGSRNPNNKKNNVQTNKLQYL